MKYADVEKLWCRIAESNDAISQFSCWVKFEAGLPPGSKAYMDFYNGAQTALLLTGVILLFAICKGRLFPKVW